MLLVFSLLFPLAALAAQPVTATIIEPQTMDDASRMVWRVVVANGGKTAAEKLDIHFWESAGSLERDLRGHYIAPPSSRSTSTTGTTPRRERPRWGYRGWWSEGPTDVVR